MAVSKAALIRVIGIVMALLWIVLLTFALPVDTPTQGSHGLGFSWHAFLIDSKNVMFPANIQVMMWIIFFICIAELFIKWSSLLQERNIMRGFSLYSNPAFVNVSVNGKSAQINLDPNEALKPELLGAIYLAKRDAIDEKSITGGLFKKVNHQFQSTNDVGDVYSAVTTAIDMNLHNVDLRYTVVRYFAWLIPTLGFIGTVIGIAMALGTAGTMKTTDPKLLETVIPMLSTAFYTTLLALLLSAAVMVLLQVIQAQDEKTVNDVGQYCLDNIVTNLKPRSK